MRVQVVYGVHTREQLACRRCQGSGFEPRSASRCFFCGGATLNLPAYVCTYDAPDDTKMFDVLITPTPERGGQRGTVVALRSDYRGPVRQAFPLPVAP